MELLAGTVHISFRKVQELGNIVVKIFGRQFQSILTVQFGIMLKKTLQKVSITAETTFKNRVHFDKQFWSCQGVAQSKLIPVLSCDLA